MDIFGGLGNQLQDVILEADTKLIGDVLSMHLSQRSDSVAVWTLRVYVRTTQGEFQLGTMVTTAPGGTQPAARTVGFGACPGAIGWKVVASCPTDNEQADLVIASSKCCSSTFGVTKNNTF